MYTYPQIYDYNLPEAYEADNPNLTAVLNKSIHVKHGPWSHQVELVSKKGQKFTSFAKFVDYDAGNPVCFVLL